MHSIFSFNRATSIVCIIVLMVATLTGCISLPLSSSAKNAATTQETIAKISAAEARASDAENRSSVLKGEAAKRGNALLYIAIPFCIFIFGLGIALAIFFSNVMIFGKKGCWAGISLSGGSLATLAMVLMFLRFGNPFILILAIALSIVLLAGLAMLIILGFHWFRKMLKSVTTGLDNVKPKMPEESLVTLRSGLSDAIPDKSTQAKLDLFRGKSPQERYIEG